MDCLLATPDFRSVVSPSLSPGNLHEKRARIVARHHRLFSSHKKKKQRIKTGGIIGFAWAYKGAKAVNWITHDPTVFPPYKGIMPIILSWFIAPVLSALAAAVRSSLDE